MSQNANVAGEPTAGVRDEDLGEQDLTDLQGSGADVPCVCTAINSSQDAELA